MGDKTLDTTVGVGAESGERALRLKGKSVACCNFAAGSHGWQIGAQAKDMIVVFMTEEALKSFQGSKGWEAGLDGNIAVITVGAGQTFPRTGSISEREDLWDGIIGVKGRVWLGKSNWSIPYYLDIGTGSSSLTWQGMLGIAYSYKWFGATVVYRHLYYDMKGDNLIQDMRFSGPALGVNFRF